MPAPVTPPADACAAAGAGVSADLAILHDGAGGLIFLLTDSGGLALQARAPLPAGGLVSLGPSAAAAGALLPPALRQVLLDDSRPPGRLRLLLDASLPGLGTLPWAQVAIDGRSLAGQWTLVCQPIAGSVAAPAEDDVRQLTVLSCDLAGSTDLMHRLGDEVYSERLTQYHRCVAQCIGVQGGRADDPQGDDGFMGYFGYPVAHEDEVARALRAALALAAALRALDLPVRLGVSTGRVVIRQGQPVGTAVHHAARLQAMAEPGTVLVGAATRRIAGERFGFELVDAAARLKGFDEAAAVWRLVDERPMLGSERFDQRGDLSAFVGRTAELQQLQRCWQAAAAGQRQTLRLVGEAGIGKSRLVREFRQWLAAAGHRTLECRCAPEHAGSAFQPLIDLMRRRLQMHEGDDPALQLARLRALQVTSGPAADEALALLGTLLSLPPALLPPLPAEESAETRRARTMALLERVALGLSDNAPVCLILEDLQWVDPSTGELMQRLIQGPPTQRVMLLLTERSAAADAAAADPGFGGATLRLAGLADDAARALLQRASDGMPMDAALADWLAARADGVPLFIEESARLAAALAAQQPGADLARTLRDRIPGTLRDLLTARLDQLPQARRAAQLASALGRSFPRALIEAVNAHPQAALHLDDLAGQLGTLVQEGLLSLQAEGGQPVYTFRHALLRDAAYQSLLERDRRALHAGIAAVLQADFGALCAGQPALLAQHHEQAGQVAEALAGWERAARHAAARSAQPEAIGHLRRALALLERSPAQAAREATELRLQLLLAGRLMASAGYGAGPVQAVYERALALAGQLDDRAALHKVRLGLEGWHFMRGDFARAEAIAGDMAAGLGATPDPLAGIQARWVQANLLFHQGRVAQALALTEAVLADYHALPHPPHAVQDPGVIGLCYAAWAHWQLGDADRALQCAQAALALAERLDHAFGVGQALGFLAVVHHFRGETDAGLGAAQRAFEVCEAGGFDQWRAHALVLRGRLRVAQGDPDAGLAEMARGHAMWAATGAVVTLPFYLALRAEGLAAAGRPADALPLLAEARALIARHGERHYEAEVRRLTGELLLAAGHGAAAAEPWLQGGLAVARELQLPGLARRSAASLAQLWAAQGRVAQAQALRAEWRLVSG